MLSIRNSIVLLALAITTTATAGVHRVNNRTRPSHKPSYEASQIEYYFDDKDISYIRPGLNVVVEDVQITADRKVQVTLRFFDDLEQPLDRDGKVTPGPISASFILAWYDGQTRQYTAYTARQASSSITGLTVTQASSDSRGTWVDLELGRARYTSGTTLPEGFDASKTHSVAIYATRDLSDIIEKTYYSNVVYDFRPDGQPVTEAWAAVANATCNSCHHDLGLHGGRRKDIKLCATCHSIQSTDPDTGNTVDLKVMIHKIHMGEELPSVQDGTPYQIIGHNNSVHDYSEVVFPQDIRNCDTCHRPDAPEGDIWYSRPGIRACGSCHDNIDWELGTGHAGGPQVDDTYCAVCHVPQGNLEYDASIIGAHTIETKSSQLAGLNTEILGVDLAAKAGTPVVTFRITNDDGSVVDPASLDRLNLLIGGPTTDYAEYWSETATGAAFDGQTAVYTFSEPLPANAAGTWAMSADVYRFVTIDDGSEEGAEVREAAFNPVLYFEVSGAKAAMSRREVVNIDRCNVCHDQLALHGGQRMATQECVICHNPMTTDEEVRPADQLPAESVHFKWLIHRIHTGHELENDFTVYGHRSSVHNYNEVGYPGDRARCEACHEPDTYSVPLPEGVLATPTERDYYTPMQPIAAACLSCHSSVEAAAHAYTNDTPFGEACGACHSDDAEFSVKKVHAR